MEPELRQRSRDPAAVPRSVLHGQQQRRRGTVGLRDDPEAVSRRQAIGGEEASSIAQRVVVGCQVLGVHVSPVPPDVPVQKPLWLYGGASACLDRAGCREHASQWKERPDVIGAALVSVTA